MYVIINFVFFAFFVVVPVTVLIINVLLVLEVRRASINAAANLGLHHQSTSSNSAVPTVMIITISFIYVLLLGTVSITSLIANFLTCSLFMRQFLFVADAVSRFVFAYNFYVYLITGKQFRSELLTLFYRCSCSSCSFCSCSFCSCSCSCSCSSSSSSSSSVPTTTAALSHGRNDARLQERRRRSTSYSIYYTSSSA